MSLRIHFERTGGLAGPAAHRTVTVDVDALPAAEAGEFRSLVEEADLPDLAARPAAGAATRPDAFRYRLVVDSGGQRHTLEFTDRDMPAPLRPLVKWLAKRASPGGP